MRRRWTLPGFALALLTACSQPEAPPYGFAAFPEQRWRFETEETFDVDGTEAKSLRFADVILRARPEPSGETEVELYLDRYYTKTQGTPSGESELSISEKGVSVQTAQSGRVGFGPNDKTLGGDTPRQGRKWRRALLEQPWQAWAQRVLADLARAHPDLPGKLERIDLMRYGHAMSIPVPGTRGDVAGGALAALARPQDRLHFAHADLSGYSVFEEAFTRGTLAGKQAALRGG